MRNAISKRRPRQNIIYMILKKAKQKSRGSSVNGSTVSSNDGTGGSSTNNNNNKPQYYGNKRGILASAVELTRRSKNTSSSLRKSSLRKSKKTKGVGGSSSSSKKKKNIFTKGQRAFYRSPKGITKVTIVGIHHDAKLEPYYTIKLRDGKEKQTDGKHLTPVQQQQVEDSTTNGSGSGSGSSRSKSKSKGGDVGGGKLDPIVQIDHLTESSSEIEDEVDDDDDEDEIIIDYGDDSSDGENGDDKDEPRNYYQEHQQQQQEKAATGGHGYPQDDDVVDDDDSSSSDDVNEEEIKKYAIGQDVYYRHPSGSILKVQIHSHTRGSIRYTITLPPDNNNQHQRNKKVKASKLASLMDLTSKELSSLMKERNKKNHLSTSEAAHVRRPNTHLTSSMKSSTTKSSSGDDEGYNTPLIGEEQHTPQHNNNLDIIPVGEANESIMPSMSLPPAKALLQPEPKMQMVEARTEDGGTKTVPKYEAGMQVHYKNAAGIQGCTILTVHLDDLLEPFYDVRLEDGKEKQTDNAHIMLTLDEEDGKDEEEGSVEAGDEEDDGNEFALGMVKKHDELEYHDAASPDYEVNNYEQQKDDYQEEDEQAPYPTPKKFYDEPTPDTSERSNNELVISTRKHQADDPTETAVLAISAQFAVGDEVLYTSSQGDQIRATVSRLQKDKKNRPYYVVMLPSGKEKQVYGHRLRHYVHQQGIRSRSRSRGPTTSNAARESSSGRGSSRHTRGRHTSRHHDHTPVRRSESVDSHQSIHSNCSRASHMSNSSRRSEASRERHSRSRDESSNRELSHHRRSSTRGRRDESVTRDQQRHSTRSRSKSRIRRSSSVSNDEPDQSRSGKSRSRDRSRSRAPSDERSSQQQQQHHHHRGSSRSRPTIGVSNSSRTAESEADRKSISKLKSFRKSFSAMRKHDNK